MASRSPQSPQKDVVLLSVGPFQGLDATTSPYYVAQNNATATQNVAVNRVYASYCTAQGRVADYFNATLPSQPVGIGIFDGFSTTNFSNFFVPSVMCYCQNGIAYIGGNQNGFAAIPGWTTIVPSPGAQPNSAAWIFAGPFAFVDSPYASLTVPNMVIGLGNLSTLTQAITWGLIAPSSAPTVAVGAAGNLSGTYYYAVTFSYPFSTLSPVVVQNMESSSGPFSAGVTVTNQQVILTAVPVSGTGPPGTTRNIYRFGGTIGGTPLLVGTIADNVTTMFTDNLADSSVTGQQLILRQDTAPPGGWASIALHKSRMWGIGSIENGGNYGGLSDLWYSNYELYTSFNSVTQVLDCSSTISDQGIGLASLESVLIVFKSRSLWACYGDTQNDFVVRKVANVGCVAKASIATAYGRAYWLSSDGVYSYDGSSSPQNISDGGVAQGSIRTLINSLLTSNNITIGTGQTTLVRGFIINRTYFLSITSSNPAISSQTLGYDMISGAWTDYSFFSSVIASNPGVTITSDISATPTGALAYPLVVASSQTTGETDQWFAAETDLGNPIASNWTTQISDSGAPGIRKQYRYIELIAPYQNGSTISVTLTTDPGVDQQVAGPFPVNLGSGPCRHRISIPKQMTGYEAQLTISGSTTQKTVVDAVSVFGYIKSEHSPNVSNV